MTGEIKIKPKKAKQHKGEEKSHKLGKTKRKKAKKNGKASSKKRKCKKSEYRLRTITECNTHCNKHYNLKPYQQIAKYLGDIVRVKFSFKPSKEMVDYTVNKLGDALFYKLTGCQYNNDNYYKSNK